MIEIHDHISSAFNNELSDLNDSLLEMGSELEKMLIRENRMELFKSCITFLNTRVELDQNGFKFDIFEH